jgi:hypothetical protein
LKNIKILTSSIVFVLLVATTSMTIPLVSAQQTNTKQSQDLLKSLEVEPLIGPSDRVINVICPSDPGAEGEECQVFEGTKVAGPTEPGGKLMAPGDTLLTGICPATFTDPSECQLFRGTPVS